MNLSREDKKNLISAIDQKISQSSSFVVAHYHGLSVANLHKLRQELKTHNCELKVYKNSLFNIAAKNHNFDFKGALKGPSAFAFSYKESVVPFKILSEFAKEHPNLEIQGGVFEAQVVGKKAALQIATLPSKEEALAILARSLITPLQQLSISFDLLIKENKLTKQEAKHG